MENKMQPYDESGKIFALIGENGDVIERDNDWELLIEKAKKMNTPARVYDYYGPIFKNEAATA